MIDQKRILKLLDEKGIAYDLVKHEAVYNMDALVELSLPYLDAHAKNLFVRDDKKQHYYLISVLGTKRLDLKEFRKKEATRPLSFVSEKDLETFLKLKAGSVTPFGLLNDKSGQVHYYLDRAFQNKKIAIHPNVNTATVILEANELVKIIEEDGHKVVWY